MGDLMSKTPHLGGQKQSHQVSLFFSNLLWSGKSSREQTCHRGNFICSSLRNLSSQGRGLH